MFVNALKVLDSNDTNAILTVEVKRKFFIVILFTHHVHSE